MGRGRRILRWALWLLAALTVGLALLGFTAANLSAVGTRAEGARLARMERSPQWSDGQFQDVLPRVEPDLLATLERWLSDETAHRRPEPPIVPVKRSRADFAAPPASGLRVTWLGHSTLLVELDGATLLLDPVWGEYVAPFAYEDARRFYPPPLAFGELPELDGVLISHDHYDHLDYPTVVDLARTEVRFFVPLGVGAHLEHWGVPGDRITELDWWGEVEAGGVRLVMTPARHFSGRSLLLTDRDCTLWAGWAIVGPEHRVFYSGDTAMFPGLAEIGRRLGPFDVTMIEVGAYNQLWADVHLGPEQAVDAHRMLQGELMIPVHWGLFDLAMHSWTEPIERVLSAARRRGVRVASPRPGESVEPVERPEPKRWWPQRPWQRADEAPVVSSHL
ncbi:MAG: MBL fold metallo-hydrolase [Myxococcales bacterium]|nr:MBL fold metallo-hydrolase [Myxococcales bacterium]